MDWSGLEGGQSWRETANHIRERQDFTRKVSTGSVQTDHYRISTYIISAANSFCPWLSLGCTNKSFISWWVFTLRVFHVAHKNLKVKVCLLWFWPRRIFNFSPLSPNSFQAKTIQRRFRGGHGEMAKEHCASHYHWIQLHFYPGLPGKAH